MPHVSTYPHKRPTIYRHFSYYNAPLSYMKHGNLLLPFLTLLIGNTVCSQTLEQLHSVDTSPKEMPLSGMSPPKDEQDVPSMTSKAGHQIPLEVDDYAVAPPNLQLEQVHIYVRHGGFILTLLKVIHQFIFGFMHCSRGTHAGWCSSSQSTSIHT